MKPFAALKSLYDRVIYANDGELLQHPQHKTHNMLNVESLLASLSLCLITGTNQSGFFIEAGVGDSALAFLGAMATITGIVAPFGGMIFSRMPKRRWLILTCILIARLLYASVVFVPLLVPNRPALSTGLMLGFVIVGGVLDATANVGAEIWMAAIVPPEIRGRYMAARNVLVNAIVPLWSLLSAAYLDIVQYRYDAFVIVFSIGAVLVIADALLMSRIPEPVYEVPVQQKVSVKEVLKKIWAAKPYLVFLLHLFLAYLPLNMSASFHNVYLMKYHGISYTLLNLVNILYIGLQLLMFPLLGKVCDRFGSSKLMYGALLMFMAETSVWIFIPVDAVKYLFFVFYIVSAISNGIFIIASFPRKYQLMPAEDQPLYTGLYTAMIALAALLGPTIGTALKGVAEAHMSAALMEGMWNMRILWVVSAAAQLLHLLVILIIRRKPEV